ncbi:MAG: LytTR family transcriptional regulator DNA-binding domain-containing protein [Pyrinomonadaceae bacterium]
MNSSAKRIRTLIVDDEALARRTIVDLLAGDPQIEIVGECSTGTEAVDSIRKLSPDLLFLDIQMPGLNGFEALARIEVEKLPTTIFVTAFDEFAVKAFEVHALDYLLKPFTDRRFNEALRGAKTNLEMKEINRVSHDLLALLGEKAGLRPGDPQRKCYLTRFMIKSGGRIFFVKVSDVDWIAADDYYIKLNIGPKTHLLRMSMNELEEKLDPASFLRIHRSTIVNFDRIKELQQNPNGDYVVVLKTGAELKLSRGRRERLEQLLTNDLG